MFSTRDIKTSFVAGVVLVAPLAVTVFVLRIIANWLLALVTPVVRGTQLARYTANHELAAQVVATVLIVAGIVALGYVAQRRIGQRVFGGFGRAVTLIPLVGSVYAGVRQVATALTERDGRYQRVVLVEYPMKGSFVLGFVTRESPPPIQSVADGAVYNVFIPNSPNPTGGRLLLVPEDRLREIDMSIRRGIRMLVTTGMAEDEPGPQRPVSEAGRPVEL